MRVNLRKAPFFGSLPLFARPVFGNTPGANVCIIHNSCQRGLQICSGGSMTYLFSYQMAMFSTLAPHTYQISDFIQCLHYCAVTFVVQGKVGSASLFGEEYFAKSVNTGNVWIIKIHFSSGPSYVSIILEAVLRPASWFPLCHFFIKWIPFDWKLQSSWFFKACIRISKCNFISHLVLG